MKRSTRVVLWSLAAFLGLELVLWLAVARHNLLGSAWVSLLTAAVVESDGGEALGPCVSVEPELFEQTAMRDREKIRSVLEGHGIELVVAPPNHNPPTGYLDRRCLEIFIAPDEFAGLNLPFLAKPHVAYYTYDFNGDAVLMLQLGGWWVYVASWNAWM